MVKTKSGYKKVKSLFGKYENIPKKWEIRTFEQLFEFLRTGTNSRSDLEECGEIGYIHYGDIHAKWNSILDCSLEEIPFIATSKVKKLPLLEEGDLIIADASEDHEGSGASILLKNVKNKKIVSGLHTIALRNQNKNISLEFKRYLVSIKFVKNQIIAYVSGISVYGLSKNNLKIVKIPLPSFAEQQKIASILSGVDALIESTQHIIEKTEKLKKGLMRQLLTRGIGHTKFKKVKSFFDKYKMIPEDWNLKKLEEIGKIVGGGTPNSTIPEYWNGKILWAIPTDITKLQTNQIENTKRKITKEGLDNSSAKLLPEGVILITSRATIGECAIATKPISTNQGFQSIICNDKNFNRTYVFYSIKYHKNELLRLAYGTTFLEINKTEIKKVTLPTPSSILEQQKIASILSGVDAYIQKNQQYKERLEKLKKGLMQKLLTGQIRVKV